MAKHTPTAEELIREARQNADQYEREPAELYRHALQSLADGDTRETLVVDLYEALKRLPEPKPNPDADLALIKEYDRQRDEADEAKQTAEQMPTVPELNRRVRDCEIEIAEKIDALLEPKRQLFQQIEERKQADAWLNQCESRVRTVRNRAPHLFK